MKHTFYECALCKKAYEDKDMVRGFRYVPDSETERALVSADNKKTDVHVCRPCASAIKISIEFLTKD